MDGESLKIKQDRLQKLKELFPEIFAENQLDWEKLKAAFGDDINFVNERYVLNWAGKSDAFRVLQQPTTATLKPVPEESVNFDTTENLFIEGENLEVLKAMQKAYYGKVKCIIIDPPYNTGSDSFIYPDRFSEKKEDYLKRIGDKDEEGYLMKEGMFRKNSKDSGHFHSNWLSMMSPRLFLAKNLLRDDGVIFVHIDDNEVHNLRMLMNEIFGEENFVEQIIWKNKYGAGAKTVGFISIHEYILAFSKRPITNIEGSLSESEIQKHNKKDEKYKLRGPYRTQPVQTNSLGDRPNLVYPILYKGQEIWPNKQWVWSKERMEEAIKNNNVEFTESNGKYSIRAKQYLKDENGNIRKGKPLSIFDGPFTQEGTQEIRELFEKDVFGFPKPSALIKAFLKLYIDNDYSQDYIVLDFFGGSGTTAQAVLELNKKDGGNRKFILVQMPEPCDENSEAYKAGYKTIADIGKERIRRVIKKIQENPSGSHSRENGNPESLFKDKELDSHLRGNDKTQDLGFKVFKLSPSSFKIWRGAEIDNEEKLTQQLDAFTNPIKPGAEKQNMLYELMLKAGYELTSPVKHVIAVSRSPEQSKGEAKQSPKGNNSIGYYSISNNELIIALDAMNEKLIEQIIAAKPQKVITLDSLFTGNDQLKTNTVLQMRDAGVDFKTI